MKCKELGTLENYVPPTWDKLFMRLVYEYASKSKDPSSKIGTVVVRDRRPILFGYNGFPEGVDDLPERLNNRPMKLFLTEHSERNAIDMAAAFGISSAGGSLYTQIMPCSSCAKAIIQARIGEIVLHRPADNYFRECFAGSKWAEEHKYSTLMFNERKMKIRYVEQLVGAVGYLGGKIISV